MENTIRGIEALDQLDMSKRIAAAILDHHLSDRETRLGCSPRCSYRGRERADHLSDTLAAAGVFMSPSALAVSEDHGAKKVIQAVEVYMEHIENLTADVRARGDKKDPEYRSAEAAYQAVAQLVTVARNAAEIPFDAL